jgi:formylglycine-generating enzyme required for sulfatase activity
LFTSTPVGVVFVDGESPFGLWDMSGNVEEYGAGPYAAHPGVLSSTIMATRADLKVSQGPA